MISASTWFDPYVLEVLEVPIAIILGTLLAWITGKVIIGPIIHVILSILFYIWVCVYFYSSDSSQFFAIHMNDSESYILELFFIGITWVLSWSLVKAKKEKFN
ncbi:hypothetical protein [Metabacillus litoralis]|uniref:hypothetical protein n=1 Tax=Metabacillus litoralis TaxID=152268 RepID=UPI001CFD8B11|nr:hypothetical protein [Metabacillus litoralis]